MKHWTEDDFTHWLHGLKDEDSHLAECGDCREESKRLLAIRKRVATEPDDVTADLLAAQRRAVYDRLDRPRRNRSTVRWVMSFASVILVVALSVSLLLRLERPTPPIYTHADEQLFSDLTSIEQSNEPRAIQPMHNLFEE